jgi:hypothetical protein
VLKLALALVFGDLQPQYDETEFLRFGAAIAGNGASRALWRIVLSSRVRGPRTGVRSSRR